MKTLFLCQLNMTISMTSSLVYGAYWVTEQGSTVWLMG
jgi:hypothetical protein